MSSEGGATVIHMDDGKAPPPAAATASSSSSYATAPSGAKAAAAGGGGRGLPLLLRSGAEGFRRCLAVVDLLLRVAAVGPTLAAAVATGTADERLSVFTEFFQFHARFDDFRAFTFLVAANAVAAGYLVLSLPLACAGVLRPGGAAGAGVRLLLLACDTAVMALLVAAGAAAAAVVYVAHWGSRRAGWAPICMQFHGFCQRTSGAVVATFLAVLVFLALILMAAAAIRRR
ncbi:hypothetical protein ACP4OV_018450 [Aristida adscensionis]